LGFGQRLIGQIQRGPTVAATEHNLGQEAQRKEGLDLASRRPQGVLHDLLGV